jgi:hypothetical protein
MRRYTDGMTAKKPAKKPAASKSTAVSKKSSQKVDIYPNRMSLAISALAAVTLVLFALIALS